MIKKHPILVHIGKNIRKIRTKEEDFISQEDLAFESKLDRSFLGRAERGEQNLSVLNLCKIAKALNTTPDQLLKDINMEWVDDIPLRSRKKRFKN